MGTYTVQGTGWGRRKYIDNKLITIETIGLL